MIFLSELADPAGWPWIQRRPRCRRWEDSSIRGGAAARGRCPGFSSPRHTTECDADHVSPGGHARDDIDHRLGTASSMSPVIVQPGVCSSVRRRPVLTRPPLTCVYRFKRCSEDTTAVLVRTDPNSITLVRTPTIDNLDERSGHPVSPWIPGTVSFRPTVPGHSSHCGSHTKTASASTRRPTRN